MEMDTTVLDTATFPMKKRIRMAFFLVLPSVADLREQITRLLQVFWQVLGKLKGRFFKIPKKSKEPNFFKIKAISPAKKRDFSSHITECDRH